MNTPRAITNSSNQVVWRWELDPFGILSATEDPSGLGTFEYNLRFPGQYFDKETNLHYNMFRDYDPAIGRYIQSDPIGLDASINTYAYVDSVGELRSPSLNAYSYANNNPLTMTDPLGLWSIQFGGYAGVGGEVVFGRDPVASGGFMTGRLGFGVGGGIKWQKSGGRPGAEPCDMGGWGGGTFVDWFQGNLGPLFAGLGSNRGINFKNDGSSSKYNTPLNPSWGFGSSFGIKAAIAGGSEWTIFSKASNQCGCQ